MYSTTTLVKNSKFSGRIVGTHQQLDEVARKALRRWLPRGYYFPSTTEIIHFEGTRGPDGLKRKSPGIDEPSHMMTRADLDPENKKDVVDNADAHANINADTEQPYSDQRSVVTMMEDHYHNLTIALKESNQVRAAFEAAWLAHMITDGLTPAHHFPLTDVKDELMTEKEMMRVFGQPVKGVMHGRSMLETMRNNWLYWGAKGHMTQHVAYEYGVAILAATLPQKSMMPKITIADFVDLDMKTTFYHSLDTIRKLDMYDNFRKNGWTTELAFETKNILLPEIVKVITLSWYVAAAEAYQLASPARKTKEAMHGA